MKKNFFKGLAGVLSLAMVVSSVAPTTADAATLKTLALDKSSLVVYLNHGVYANHYNLDALKLADNAVKWSSSNGAVAAVSTYGNVVGKKVGTATVYVKKAGYATKKVKVTVKSLTESVKIDKPVDTLKVGEKHDFNAIALGYKGGLTSEKTKWTVSDPAMATVNAWGVVTPLKAGTFDVVATNGKATDKVTVKVPMSITSTKLTKVDTVEVTVDDATGITAKDVVVTNTKSKTTVPVKFSIKDKVITLVGYSSFTKDTTYEVAVKDAKDQFTVVIGDIASIALEDQTVQSGSAQTIKYNVYDVNGLDITNNYPLSKLVIKTSKLGSIDVDNKITLADKDSAFVTLTYVQFDTTGKDISVVSREAKITGLNTAVDSLLKWTVASDNTAIDKEVHTIALESTATVFMKYKTTITGTEVSSTGSESDGFTFTSLTPSILFVDAKTGVITPNAVGEGTIQVKKGDYETYLKVTVTEKAKLNALSAAVTSTTLSSTYDTNGETKNVTVKILDQFNNDFALTAASTPTVTIINGNYDVLTVDGKAFTALNQSQSIDAVLSGAKSFDLVLKAVKDKEGTAVLKVVLNDKITYLTVGVSKSGIVANYIVEVPAVAVDSKVDAGAAAAVVNFTVKAVDATGKAAYPITEAATTVTVKNAKGDVLTDAAGIKFDGRSVASGTAITVGTDAKAIADGTYTIVAKVNGVKEVSANFVVKSTRSAAVLTVDKVTVDATPGDAVLDTLAKAISAKVDGKALTLKSYELNSGDATLLKTAISSNFEVKTGTVSLYVKTATFTDGSFDYVVDVAQIIDVTL